MKRFGVLLLAATTAMLLPWANAFPAPTPPANAPAPAPLPHDARFSRLLGRTVEDPNAQELGTINDFVLAAPSGLVEYAIVGSGGLFGLGTQNRAIPASTLSLGTIVRGILGTSVTRQQWDRYPAFAGDLAALPVPPSSGPAPTGSATVSSPGQHQSLELASQLLGATVQNRQHQTLGTVSDLLLALDRRKPALVLIRDPRFLRRGETFAVPLPLLSHAEEGNTLLLDANPEHLQQAPFFSEEAWSNAASQGANVIYRVSGSAPT